MEGSLDLAVKAPDCVQKLYTALNNDEIEQLQFKRHVVSDFAVLEQVDKRINQLKMRWVRRVEWQIKQAVPLITRSKSNDVLESPAFAAAGIPDMKFIFFPKGIDERWSLEFLILNLW